MIFQLILILIDHFCWSNLSIWWLSLRFWPLSFLFPAILVDLDINRVSIIFQKSLDSIIGCIIDLSTRILCTVLCCPIELAGVTLVGSHNFSRWFLITLLIFKGNRCLIFRLKRWRLIVDGMDKLGFSSSLIIHIWIHKLCLLSDRVNIAIIVWWCHSARWALLKIGYFHHFGIVGFVNSNWIRCRRNVIMCVIWSFLIEWFLIHIVWKKWLWMIVKGADNISLTCYWGIAWIVII